ncbi:MAG: MBL fold metallo-hydrolase [Actinomycetota bacterium]
MSAPKKGEAERIAEGVWVVRGGVPRVMNVFMIEDEGGITLFDAGIQAMTAQIQAAAASLGGVRRVVLGHAHPDHRGAAPGLGAPVMCHPAERADAEGDGGVHYFDYSRLRPYARPVFPSLLRHWDGGPVEVSATVEEGDEVAGFAVIHAPGHAPGLIALWRERDGLLLSSDAFYTLDPQTGIKRPPGLPHSAFNLDDDEARRSLLKLAALEPNLVWPGHTEPIRESPALALRAIADA